MSTLVTNHPSLSAIHQSPQDIHQSSAAIQLLYQGLAIGLQDDSSHMISVFLAVIIHKAVMSFRYLSIMSCTIMVVMSFSLGLNIAQSNLSKKSFVWSNICFSLSSPIGVGIGGILGLQQSSPLQEQQTVNCLNSCRHRPVRPALQSPPGHPQWSPPGQCFLSTFSPCL